MNGTCSDVFHHADAFFTNPTTAKKELFPQKQTTEFGYHKVKHEKEYVTFRCRTQQENALEAKSSAADLESSTVKLWGKVGILLHRILCDIAWASEHETKVWDAILEGTLDMPPSEKEMSYTLMRIFRYLRTTGTAKEHPDHVPLGTALGLQVCDRINSTESELHWIATPEGTGHAIILVGQTLKMQSSGALNVGIYRVIGNPLGRDSIVYALRHSSRSVINLGLFEGNGQIQPEELYKFMGVGKVNINAVKDKGAKQRNAFEGAGQG